MNEFDLSIINWEDPEHRRNTLENIRKRVLELLINDRPHLMHSLYRLDINERLFNEAMALMDPEKIAQRIAELILDREIQKAESRRKYKNEKPDEENLLNF